MNFNEDYRWFFSSLHINYVTLDLDSTVMTRYGSKMLQANVITQRRRVDQAIIRSWLLLMTPRWLQTFG